MTVHHFRLPHSHRTPCNNLSQVMIQTGHWTLIVGGGPGGGANPETQDVKVNFIQ